MAQFAAASNKRPSNSALDGRGLLLLANPEIQWPIRASTSKGALSGAVSPTRELRVGDGPEGRARPRHDHLRIRAGLGDDQHRLTLRHARQFVPDLQECPVCRYRAGEPAANVEVVATLLWIGGVDESGNAPNGNEGALTD